MRQIRSEKMPDVRKIGANRGLSGRNLTPELDIVFISGTIACGTGLATYILREMAGHIRRKELKAAKRICSHYA